MSISCCLIGEDNLLIPCGNILLAKNHLIEAVVTPTKKVQDWAENHNILFVPTLDELSNHVKTVDYIFSITLTYDITKLARYGAINYHDSLSLKCAGVNTASWAIYENEKMHGVMWHFIRDEKNEGKILTQETFPIHQNDTTLTLNLRCYEAAIKSFKELISSIETGNLVAKKQNLLGKKCYAADSIIPNFGFIDWQTYSAELIDRMSRATIFGRYNNTFGTLKIYFQNKYFIVPKLEVSPINYTHEFSPGTVVAIEKSALYVSTITTAIKIETLISNRGTVLTIDKFVKKYGISVGYQFPLIEKNSLVEMQEPCSSILQNEKFWVEKLKDVGEHTTFSARKKNEYRKFEAAGHIINLKKILSKKEIPSIKNIFITAALTYLFRLNNCENISVFLLHPEYKKLHNKCSNLLSIYLPLIFNVPFHFSLKQTLNFVSENIVSIYKHNSYFSDISTRYSILEGKKIEPNIVINFSGKVKTSFLPKSTVLYFEIDEDEGTIEIFHRFETASENRFKEIIPHLTQHLVKILISLVDNPSLLIGNFCFLTEVERYKLLKNWGIGKKLPLPSLSIPELFRKQVELQPDATAIFTRDQSVSYQQLWETSEKIANFLRAKNLPPQTLIGVYLTRSIEMIATILGILKANAVYVPLDIKSPLLKIGTVIKSAEMRYLFTQEKFLKTLQDDFDHSQQDIELFCIEKILLDNQENISYIEKLDEDFSEKLAYIIFTSGTTGVPKGVMVTQKNVINYCFWFLNSTQFSDTSIMDFSSSIAFDLSVPCAIAPLLARGKIAICGEEQKNNAKQYLLHLKTHRVTHVEMTPGYLQLLLNYPNEVRKLTDLSYLLLGADVVPKVDVMKWLSFCPNHQLVNEYGPTETTVAVTSYFVNPQKIITGASIPIGSPAYNTQCYILDKYKNLCPSGVIGELYVGGAQVTKGYLNNPELTHDKFILSNLSGLNEMLYKTGDMAYWLSDGNLQFLGRNDHQVKIQGYRIELTEIESVLVKISSISQALVVVQESKFKEKYLRAYLVCSQAVTFNDEMRDFLTANLQKYMIPKEFCVIDSIPLKENEKIDYSALVKQKFHFLQADLKNTSKKIADSENIIKNIWENAFYNASIGIHDDFFEMGGDSLMALQIVAELQSYYGINIPLYYLFKYPTIALLSKKIGKLHKLQRNTKTKVRNKENTSIIQLSKGTHEIPLFLVHPVGGTIFWYKPLASCLQGKYTIYGIQNQQVNNDDKVFTSLEEMASHYLTKIKKIYSGENYYIGGASFGSNVAFEMAHQLMRENKDISFLGLFDGWAHYPSDIMEKTTFDLLKDCTMYDKKISSDVKNALIKEEEYRKQLLVNYKLSLLDANATLFKATKVWPSFGIEDDYNGWKPFIKGKITTYKIPGDHETMFFNPHVQILARILDNHLKHTSVLAYSEV